MLYDYLCEKCDIQFEEFSTYEDRNKVLCPKCDTKAQKLITSNVGVSIDSTVRDGKGNPIWHPGTPYYDKALQKTFHTKKEKQQYMKENKLIMDGSDDKRKTCAEAGDARKCKPIYSI